MSVDSLVITTAQNTEISPSFFAGETVHFRKISTVVN